MWLGVLQRAVQLGHSLLDARSPAIQSPLQATLLLSVLCCADLWLWFPYNAVSCSVLYSSATGASETQNMAYMTRLLPVGFKDRCDAATLTVLSCVASRCRAVLPVAE
jgi:hypothetical protein